MQVAAGAAQVARVQRNVVAAGAGISVGGGKGSGKAGASSSSGVVQRRHEEPGDSEDDAVEEEGEGRRGGRSGRRKERRGDREEPRDVQVWQWLDDLLTGFAEIHKVTVANGHSCADCTRRHAYTGKQRIVEAVDGVYGTVNPTPDQRSGRGQGAPITFRHE